MLALRRSESDSDEGLTLETSASESLYGGQIPLSTQLIKSNYSHRRSTTVFLETYPFYSIECLPACQCPWLTDWLFDWLTDWLTVWLTDWLTDWLNVWLTDCQWKNWKMLRDTIKTVKSFTQMKGSVRNVYFSLTFDWLSVWLTDWLTDYWTACLTDWLTDWLTGWGSELFLPQLTAITPSSYAVTH